MIVFRNHRCLHCLGRSAWLAVVAAAEVVDDSMDSPPLGCCCLETLPLCSWPAVAKRRRRAALPIPPVLCVFDRYPLTASAGAPLRFLRVQVIVFWNHHCCLHCLGRSGWLTVVAGCGCCCGCCCCGCCCFYCGCATVLHAVLRATTVHDAALLLQQTPPSRPSRRMNCCTF
jgi:hypothetical protein